MQNLNKKNTMILEKLQYFYFVFFMKNTIDNYNKKSILIYENSILVYWRNYERKGNS